MRTKLSIKNSKDGYVNVSLHREDLLDLYTSLRGLTFNDSTFASDELKDLIKKFFGENKDVESDVDVEKEFRYLDRNY